MIKFFNSLLFVIAILSIFSCGLDEEKKPAEMPSEWSGGEDEFQNKFTTREDGNETLVFIERRIYLLKVRLNEMEQIQIQSSPSRMEN